MSRRYRPVQSEVLAYSSKGKAGAFNFSSTQQLEVYNARILNRSGAAVDAGICRKLSTAGWKVYTKIVSAYADVTSAVQAGTATQVVTATNDDGFIVQGRNRFGFIGLTVSNTATGGTYAFQYWNGSAWTTLTVLESFTNFNSTGDKFVVFLPPTEWVAGDDTGATNQAWYSIRIIHTTAPADAGSINAMWVAQILDFMEALADNAGLQLLCDTDSPLILEGGENIMPYFATADAKHMVACIYGVN